jgi:eukaryotic-like serine/threonine-protein kinase
MASDDTIVKEDRLLAGRYRLTRKLGSGGMADVWLADDEELGRRVAVKILHERYANDEQFVERFRREATHAAGLSHPNIVSIYDRGEADGSYYIVMEYVEGRTLKELIVTRGPCPVPVAVAYTRQILGALGYAHRNGIIHRDIKPHNVIVDREGRVKVTDFGIARAGTSQMTEAGSIIGTAQYLSPEQARGAPVDESSDLYSTGVVLFEILTGSVPFNGETPVEIAMKHLSETPQPPSTIRSEIPHDLDLIVLRALAKEPADRYRAASDMSRDLDLVSRGEGVGSETESAATIVLSGKPAPGAEAAAATMGATGRPPSTGAERYRAYDGPVRTRRAWWPWLIGIGAALALAAGGYFLYLKIQDQIDKSQPIAVSNYTGIRQSLAVTNIESDGFTPFVEKGPSSEVAAGYVIEQDPPAGSKQPRDSRVTILVSTGKATVTVPSVVGQSITEAVQALTQLGLDPTTVRVNSDKPVDIVTAQSPPVGAVVVEGAVVRINVSNGPKQVAVPSVLGLPYDQASAQLQAAGFFVSRTDVESNEPAGNVVGQSPAGNTTAAAGAKVTLQVSSGPTTVTVPDVTQADSDSAKAALDAAGFTVNVIQRDTDDPTLENIVISQTPTGDTEAKPKSKVTIYVGHYVLPPTGTDTTSTTPTTPTP